MEFLLADLNLEYLPPADTRLVEISAEPYPGGKRLRVVLNLTSFQQKTHEISRNNTRGVIVAMTSIVVPAATKLDQTMHIRNSLKDVDSHFTLSATIYYPEIGEVDHRLLPIVFPFNLN